MRSCPFERKLCVGSASFCGPPGAPGIWDRLVEPGSAVACGSGRLALVAVNQILPYGRVIRSRMKPAADELTGVLSWTCKRVGVF
jgi:hypothetical protein